MKRSSIPNLYIQRGKFYYAKQVNGKRPFIALNTSDETEAILMARNLERSPLLHSLSTGLKAEIDQFIAYKQSKRQYSRDSAKTKILILKSFADWLPDNNTVATISPNQCQDFYDKLLRQVSESTAEGYMMTLSSFFNWASKIRRLRIDNPIAKVSVIHAEHIARKQFCDKITKNDLLAAASTDDLRFITFCGFDAGLRRGEISEARVDWFEIRHGSGSLHVQRSIGKRLRPGEREWRPKYNKERVVPLTAPFREFLKDYLKDRDPLDFALQPDVPHGDARYRYDIRRPFRDFMKTQKLEWVTPHVMRHSFASILKSEGESIPKIAEWLGNSERVTERTYAWLKPDDRGIHVLT